MKPEFEPTSRAPASFSIDGFHYSANRNGHTGLAIHADRLAVKKKKIGKLRFGMLKEAFFTNARIELDRQAFQSGKQDPSPTSAASHGFAEALDFESIGSFSMKKVVAIHFSPIDLRLKVDGQLKAAVTADRASIKPPGREIQFSGNVRWTRGTIELRTDRLRASLEGNTLRAPKSYRIVNRETVTTGRNLQSDLMLTRIDSPSSDYTAQAAPDTKLIHTTTIAQEKSSHAENR